MGVGIMSKNLNRRMFLTAAISSAVLLTIKTNTTNAREVESEKIDLSVYSLFILQNEKLSKTNDKRIINLLPKTSANEAWLNQYDKTRNIFIKNKKLLEIKKYENKEKVIIVNKWSSKKDFEEFCENTNMKELIKNLSSDFEFQHKLVTTIQESMINDYKIFHHEIYA